MDSNNFLEQRAFSSSSVSSGFLLDILCINAIPVQTRRKTRSAVSLKETENAHTPYVFEVWANVKGSCFQFLLEYIALRETRMGEQKNYSAIPLKVHSQGAKIAKMPDLIEKEDDGLPANGRIRANFLRTK